MSSMPFKLQSDESIVKALMESDSLKSIKPSAAERSSKAKSRKPRSRKPSAAQQRLISFCSSEGVVVGKLTFLLDGDLIDCVKSEVTLLPYTVEKVDQMHSNGALFILLVAHRSEFGILSEDKFYNRFPCIIFLAHEAELPHKSYTSFLSRMKVELGLPVLALVNCDPVGLQIMSCYDAVDAWLGFRHSDLELYDLKPQPLTSRDLVILQDLKKCFNLTHPKWVPELSAMETYKEKANISTLRYYGDFYLPEVYLPLKLLEQAWI